MLAPIPTFDARVEEITESQSAEGHWFWSTLWQSKKIYRDVLLGSLLVNVFAVALPLYIMNVYVNFLHASCGFICPLIASANTLNPDKAKPNVGL